MKEKNLIEEKTRQLIGMTGSFCQQFLDEDYRQLCEKLIRKMSRKRAVPFLSGRMEIWAAAVVYALGSINFLFDNSFEPYATADDICNFFNTSKSTTAQKSKVIRDMFKMGYYDGEFSTNHMKENSPFSNFVMVNGLIVDKRHLPPEVQEMFKREGK
jgi:hypothetical protein